MIRGLVILFILVATGVFFTVALPAQTGDPLLADEQRALLSAREQSERAQQRSIALLRQAETATNDAGKARIEAAAMAARIEAAEADIRAARARIAIVTRLQDRQRDRLAEKQKPVVRLTAALQMMTRKPTALAIVEPRSLDELIYIRSVMSTVLPEIERRTASLRSEVNQGEKLRIQSARAVASLDESQRRLTQRRKQLAYLTSNGKAGALQFPTVLGQDRALALGEEARDILDLMGQIRESGAVRESLAALDGPMLRPNPNGLSQNGPNRNGVQATRFPARRNIATAYLLPVTGDLVTGLGERSDSGYRSRGLTIAVEPDVQIVAPADGRVAFAGPYGGYDNILIIEHDADWTSLITNMAAINVEVGDSVKQGAPIGRAAGRGDPNVTVELRRQGRPIDIAALIY
ncbi:murein hydrolase activator EnvC family protein [Parasphingorhabdus sp.]|uniref:murein hydrolase activator EnvC family protein n=1 Tax=Parasphingorhabdus sp. TaxID=2709688 RepID=UPI002F925970